jgi:hypothetical protein
MAAAAAVRFTQTAAGGGTHKCLATFDCNATAGAALQVCNCDGSGNCGAREPSCTPQAFEFDAKPVPGPASSTAMSIRSVLNDSLCLTLGPRLKSWMDITLQIFAKPLASGAVAALAFNRGTSTVSVRFDWAQLSLDPARRYAVRDLWAKRDLGSFVSGFNATVQPHDVVMVLVSNAAS